MMKVLIMSAIYPSAEKPALGTFVHTQIESLRKAGVEVELLLLDGPHRKWNYAQAIFQLRRSLASSRIDLVHAHIAYVGMVARTQFRVPVVVTYHGSDLLGLIDKRGRKSLLSPLVVGAGKVLARCVSATIVQSTKMAALLHNRPNVHVIPCEIDLENFQPMDKGQARVQLGLQPDKKYLLFAANPAIGVKRFPLAKAAAEELKQRDSSVELLAVFKETQDRFALYLNACDALVLPSFSEGSPNVIKQAMACNLPIVATDVGDVRDVLGSTAGCYVCEPEVGDFVRKLELILSQGQKTQGRAHVQHLAGPSIARKIIGVYEQVLKNRGASLETALGPTT